MATQEYMDAVLRIAKEYLPEWLFDEIHKAARASAGGKRKGLAKLDLTEMRPPVLAAAPDTEIGQAWLRLNQWYGQAKEAGRAVENFVNAGIWVADEMEKRGFDIDKTTDFYKAMEQFRGSKRHEVRKRFYNLPQEVVLVRDFVSMVGSAAKQKKEPNDIDVLFRANQDDNGDYIIQGENMWLPVRNVLNPDKMDDLHFISNPQGAHGDFVSMYDLILRRKPEFATTIVKAASEMPGWMDYLSTAPDGPRYDLGCGTDKPEGFTGIDIEQYPEVDMVCDLSQGLPIADETAAVIRANHFIEHLDKPGECMKEIHRALMPGGLAFITVPSTNGEGAFAHPDHQSFWNPSSFEFWTNPELLDERPQFDDIYLNERGAGNLKYVDVIMRKPCKKAALIPFEKFTPPKPEMAGQTEAFELKDLLEWAADRWPVDIEQKYNGFRCVCEKQGDRTGLFFEGQMDENQIDKFPTIKAALSAIPGDYIIDCDLGILKDGTREARPDLMRFNADRPEFAANEKPVLTIFDLPYWDKDLSGEPFSERRKQLEKFYPGVKDKALVQLSPVKWTNNPGQLKAAARWAFDQDHSEGLVAKSPTGEYALGGTSEWFKLKRVVELKVLVLDTQETKVKGIFNYYGGLLPSVGEEWTNTKEYGGKTYIDLGKTFSSKLRANPGDIITVQILELIPDEEKKTLAWLGATVQDIDDTRKEPYTAAQAIDIATRGQVIQKAAMKIVPSAGKAGAKIAFIGASPGQVEAARGEPFVGPSGETLTDLYLKPLGLSRSDVFLTNAVPELLTDENGRVREPNNDEIDEYKPWLMNELAQAKPQTIIALGQTAKKALGNMADFVLPHPMAIRRFGDSGEISRKLKQIKQAITKQQGEGETRADLATKFWQENWQDMPPMSGSGKFVYQHHWRGLTEDETKLDEPALLQTDHSVHGDLRLTNNTGNLWGYSVFLGTTEANRQGDRLENLQPDDNLQGTFKLEQPKEWLTVASKKPYISEPGGVGATSKEWAKFFQEDTGTYDIGVWREHMIEVFLHGDKLKGRFILEYAPVGEGQRVWLIDKPKDQTPYAESHKLEEVISELKQKGQKWLIWAKPGEKPQKIDVTKADTSKIQKEYYAIITKADEEQRIVTGVVLEPETTDTQGDVISAEEIEKAAYYFMEKSRTVGDSHRKKAQAQVIESYIAPDDLTIGGQPVKKGSWVISVKIQDDRIWEGVKKGEYTGFSVGGFGIREEVA